MAALSTMTKTEKQDLKDRIARVMSEILSDKHDCKVTLTFVSKERTE